MKDLFDIFQLQTITTSIDLVKIINKVRSKQTNYIELLHKTFLAKVPEVLGTKSTQFVVLQHGKRIRYDFPEREAWLMLMSYGYELQAYIYDRLKAEYQASNLRQILGSVKELETKLDITGSEWGKIGVEQKRKRQILNKINQTAQAVAQPDLL